MRYRESQPETGPLYFGMGFVSHASEQGSVCGLQGRGGRGAEGRLPQPAAARLPLRHWLGGPVWPRAQSPHVSSSCHAGPGSRELTNGIDPL